METSAFRAIKSTHMNQPVTVVTGLFENRSRSKSLNTSPVKMKKNYPKRSFSLESIDKTRQDLKFLFLIRATQHTNKGNFSKNREIKRSSLQSIETNTCSTFQRSALGSPNFDSDILLDRLPCSSSLIDMLVLLFRYNDLCGQLIDLCIPMNYFKLNQKFFQAKFNCLNNLYQVF